MLQRKARWKDLSVQTEMEIEQNIPLQLSPTLEKLLVQRGVTTAKEASEFLSPDLERLHDPELMLDMVKARKRVQEAIEREEKILIFGDYDADGVTSTALLMKTLKELNANCDYYIPNRFTEGYGPNEAAFRQAHENGFSLIITVDTGIAATHEATVAKQLGIDLIITDHHEVQATLPDAFAIIHPAMSDQYPYKDLAGVGVAFKFAEYLLGFFPKHLLPYVAIGTIADLVPLTGENRILSYYGLIELTKSQSPGLSALKQVCQIEEVVSEEDVGFRIGPRLNAVGRLEDASFAVELLLTDSDDEAIMMAEEMDALNAKRQQIVKEITSEAEKLVDPNERDVIIVAKEGWNEGVLGIVASKLVQLFNRPAIVLTDKKDSDAWKGSARSIPAFDLFKNCMEVSELFTSFGGHSQAAGMTIPKTNLEQLRSELGTLIKGTLTEEDYKQEIVIAATIEITDLSIELIDEINRLAPFGMSNPKPVFKVKEIPVDVKQIGADKSHLKMLFTKNDVNLDAIGFGLGHLYHRVTPEISIELVGELSINEWNGNRKVQLMIQDLEIPDWQLFDYRGRKNYNLSHLKEENTLIIGHLTDANRSQYQTMEYSDDFSEMGAKTDLVLFSLPKRMDDFKKVIKQIKPVNIYICYQIENSAYLTSFPKREDFVWIYAYYRKKGMVDLKKEIPYIMQMKSWSKEKVIFLTQVFSDLDFVTISGASLEVNPNPDKKSLNESIHYQARLEEREIEASLYYSNYKQIREDIHTILSEVEQQKEDVVNGL